MANQGWEKLWDLKPPQDPGRPTVDEEFGEGYLRSSYPPTLRRLRHALQTAEFDPKIKNEFWEFWLEEPASMQTYDRMFNRLRWRGMDASLAKYIADTAYQIEYGSASPVMPGYGYMPQPGYPQQQAAAPLQEEEPIAGRKRDLEELSLQMREMLTMRQMNAMTRTMEQESSGGPGGPSPGEVVEIARIYRLDREPPREGRASRPFEGQSREAGGLWDFDMICTAIEGQLVAA